MTKYAPLGDIREAGLSYAGVEALMHSCRGKWIPSRRVGRNTFLQRRDGGIALLFHATDIITWHRDDTITLNTGGWYTKVTKNRMNEWLPSRWNRDNQKSNARYIQVEPVKGWFTVQFSDDERVPFHDGMVIDLHTFTEFTLPYDPTEDKDWNQRIDKILASWLRRTPEFGYWQQTVWLADEDPVVADREIAHRILSNMLMGVYDLTMIRLAIDDGNYVNPDTVKAHLIDGNARHGHWDIIKRDLRRSVRKRLWQGHRSQARRT